MNAHQDNMRMVDDLDQSDEVRSLLRAGIDDEVAGYDFNTALTAHVAAVAALPTALQAPVDVATTATISGKALLAWIGVPVASATVMAALWLGGTPEAPVRHGKNAPIETKEVARPRAASPMASTVKIETSVGPTSTSGAAKVDATQVTERATQRRTVRVQRNAAAVVIDHKPQAGDTRAIEVAPEETAAPTSAIAATNAATQQAAQPSAAEREESARLEAAAAEQERIAREEARRVAEERLKREMSQLMQAKQALTGNPARALSLAQAGEQEFRNSMFSEERQHVLLLALIKLGRVDEAERRAQPFLSAHPDSPFARRIRNALQDAK